MRLLSWLMVLVLMLPVPSTAATLVVPPGSNLQSAISRAQAGDTIELQDGVHTGGANLSGKTGITIRAARKFEAELRGGQVVLSGSGCTIEGVQVTGVRTSWNTGAVLITGRGNTLRDVYVHDNESLGIDISGGDATLIERVRSNHNGNLGLNTGAPTNGNNVEGLVIRHSEFRDNNYGMANPVWKAIEGKTVFGADKLWYRGAGDAAGGVKICNAHDVLIEDVTISGNTGAGLWFDVYCGKKTVRRVESFGQKAIPGDPAFFAVGIEVELEKDGVTLIEDCYSHDNAGSEFAIFEASNVTIRNCLARGNIELRDLGGGREAYRPRNIRIENTKLTGRVTYPNQRTQAEVTLVNVAQNQATLPAWTGGTPTTQLTPEAQWTDGAGNRWELVGGQLRLNGVLRSETARVTEARVVDGVFYQLGSGQWWKWTGTGWNGVQSPPNPSTAPSTAPATQPSTQPSTAPATQPVTIKVIAPAHVTVEVIRP